MREFDYDFLKKLVWKFLWKQYHERHLEDCIQFCALLYFEGRTNIEWNVIEYCRQNGIGERGKQSAKTLEERSVFVGLETDETEDVKENGFLFKIAATKDFIDQEDRPNIQGDLEEFLLPLGFKVETMRWVLKNYQPRHRTREKMFNISRTHSA